MLNGRPDVAAGGGGGGTAPVSLPLFGAFPWIWLCAGTLVASLRAKDAAGASAPGAADALALVVALEAAAEVVLAELLLALLGEDETAASAPGAPALAMAALEACVCMVVAGGSIEPSWNDCGLGGSMGNEPAGQRHLQAQEPACSAEAAALPVDPAPATTVTGLPAFEVVVAATRGPLESLAISIEACEALPFAVAVPLEPDPPPATTVTGPAPDLPADAAFAEPLLLPDPACTVITGGAPLFDAEPFEALMPPAPACTVTAAGAPLFELLFPEPIEEFPMPPAPAWTVMVGGFAPAAEVDTLPARAIDVPFPPLDPSAFTVTALPAAVVVVAASRAPSVSFAEFIAEAFEDTVSAAGFAPAGAPPPADTVTAAGLVPFIIAPSPDLSDAVAASAGAPAFEDS